MLDYTDLFSPNDYEKLYWIFCGKYRKFKKPKISYILEKTLVLYIICSSCKKENEKIF